MDSTVGSQTYEASDGTMNNTINLHIRFDPGCIILNTKVRWSQREGDVLDDDLRTYAKSQRGNDLLVLFTRSISESFPTKTCEFYSVALSLRSNHVED